MRKKMTMERWLGTVQTATLVVVTALLSLPGILYCCTCFDIPLLRKVLWSCYITAFPVVVAMALQWIGRRWVRMAFYALALPLFLVNTFLVLNFDTTFSPSVILLCLETNGQESAEFLRSYGSSSASLLAYALTLLMALAIVVAERCGGSLQLRQKVLRPVGVLLCLWVGVGAFHCCSMAYMLTCRNQLSMGVWMNTIGLYDTQDTFSNLLYSVHHFSLTAHDNDEAVASNEQAARQMARTTSADSLQVVVVIGESFSKHHSSLYGYPKLTNPALGEEAAAGRLFVFQDVVAPYNLTSQVMKNLLSTNSLARSEYWTRSPIFPVVFRTAGFRVSMYDNQRIDGINPFHDFSIGSFLFDHRLCPLAYDAMNDSTYAYDQQLVDAYFTSADNNMARRRLVVFHLMGQHSYAGHRYPDEPRYRRFTPADYADTLSVEERRLLAHYDNATCYNDAVVRSIIDHYRQQCAVVVYLSDHGEEVYDYRHFAGRSHERTKTAQAARYQYEVPFVVWCSEAYQHRHPQVMAQLATAVSLPYTTDKLPHLLFGLSAIDTPYYRPADDPLSPRYRCGRRLIQDAADYDALLGRPLP